MTEGGAPTDPWRLLMSTALQPAPTSPAPQTPGATSTPAVRVVDRLYRLTVDQYHAMAEAGILGTDDRIELLEGLLVTKMTKRDPHILATELAQGVLIRALPGGWYVSMQNPITIAECDSEPEPDAKVVRGTPRDFKGRRVVGSDVALVVEVSDSTLRDDQTTKKALYARAMIPSYWIVNLPANRLEVYSDPTGPDPSPDYRRRSEHGPDDVVPLILDGQEVARIAVRDLLP
jgi:Uma2 family endonuclease